MTSFVWAVDSSAGFSAERNNRLILYEDLKAMARNAADRKKSQVNSAPVFLFQDSFFALIGYLGLKEG